MNNASHNSENSTAPLTAVAMSGGVDSSTVAAMLRQQGEPIVGLTMQLWNQRRLPELDAQDTKAIAAAALTMFTTPSASPNIWVSLITL